MMSYPPAKITIPLDIPDVSVLRTEATRDGKFLIEVESDLETTICGICGQKIKCTYGHGEKISLRHLSVLGYETYIFIRPKRGQCKNCWHEPTTTQLLEWYEQRSPHTKAYDEHILKQLVNSTVEDVSMKENVGYDAVVGVLKRRVAVKVKWEEVDNIGTLGIDEIAMTKGRKNFAAILSARQDNGDIIILGVLENRLKVTVREFLEKIPPRLHSTIHTFCTDMWEGYINAIAEFMTKHKNVKAEIVIDRFHVAQHYRDGFDKLRKKEMKRLKEELPEETYEADCKGSLWLLRKNQVDLDDEEKAQLNRIFAHSPQLKAAYTLREELTAIFESPLPRAQGKHCLLRWMEKVRQNEVTCFDKFLKTLQAHLEWIANYFSKRASSGFVEGLNNKIKTIKRRCYGIKKVGTLFQRIWLDLNGYRLFT